MKGHTKKGKPIQVELWRFNDMMIRTKYGHNMKDKPLDIIVARTTHKGKPYFKRPLVIALSGKRRREVETEEAFRLYAKRYDIEPFFRYIKQRMLFEAFHSCKRDHIDSWLLIGQLACWLLYCSRDEIQFRVRKWETAALKQQRCHSLAQTHRGAESLYLTFDPGLFKPLSFGIRKSTLAILNVSLYPFVDTDDTI